MGRRTGDDKATRASGVAANNILERSSLCSNLLRNAQRKAVGLVAPSGRRVADTWASLGRSFPPSRNRPMTQWTISGSISTIVSNEI
jgi:hypothetical protein